MSKVQDYRVYFISEDGGILQRLDFIQIDERSARARAEQLAIDFNTELWELDQHVAIYRCATYRAGKSH